jgi:transposase, IS5 family
VPDDTTLLRWANLIQPATLHHLLDHVVLLARSLKITRGRQRRIDGTVVSTNIHHPTDSTLLYDGVRVLSRLVVKAKQAIQETTVLARSAMRDRTRSAKRQLKRIMEAARPRGAQVEARMQTAYQRLLTITTIMVKPAERVGSVLMDQGTPLGRKLATALHRFVPLVQQVKTQTTRRMFQGEAVPAPETVVSLFAPHTAIIRKGQPGRPTECGRGLWLDEVDGGIISRDAVLEGNLAEDAQLPPSLDHPLHVFQRPPRRLAGDRGVHTTAHERYATTHGVKPVVLPKPGTKSATRMAHAPQRWFRRGHHGRAGIEGRSSGLKRRHQLDRCRAHGPDGLDRWVGWGVITHKLRVMAQATAHEPAGQVILPCHGLIRGKTLRVHAVSQRVLHHNLVLGV